MSSHYYLAFVFAGLAAVGNAIYAYGQKRAEVAENPFLFLILALLVCISLLSVSAAFYSKTQVSQYLSDNKWFVIISGVGFYLTFMGFYFLYTRYGASYYSLYAVLSILTTSILVGIYVFKEPQNIYHMFSIFAAILTIVLFAIGQYKAPA